MIRKSWAAVLISACLLTLYGCVATGKESFDLARELERQNRLNEAVSLYEDALAKEPDNRNYKNALLDTKALLVKRHIDNARSLAGAKPLSLDNLKKAQNEADKALRYSQDNVEAKQLSAYIKKQMDGLIKSAELLYSAASKTMETNDWAAAVSKLREINTLYPNYLDTQIKLAKAENYGMAYYMLEAEKFGRADDWASAIKMLALAKGIQHNNIEIAVRLKDAQAKHTPDYYLMKAEDAAKGNDWDTAMKFVDKARASSMFGISSPKLDLLSRQASGYFAAKAEESLAAKHIYGAYAAIASAVSLSPETASEQKTTETINELLQAMIAKAEAYEAAGRLGNAYVWYGKASKLMRGNRGIAAKVQKIKDKIRQRVVKKIAIMDFTPPSNNADVGRVMTDSLLSYLTKNSTSDVKILARDVLGAILREIELGQAGLYDIESAKKVGKLKGTDVFIFGSVLLYSIEKNVDEGFKSVNAVVGKKAIPNPAYQSWAASHPRPTDAELSMAPKQFLEEEIRETIRYKVATHKKTASANVSFRVIDVEDGEVVITRMLKNKKEAEDTYSEGVDFAGVPYKAVKLPSDTELFEQVIDATVAELGYEVLSRFQNLQLHYYNSAELLKKKGDFERAIEKYIDVIHVEELKNIHSPVSEDASKEVENLFKMTSP